MRPPVQVPLLRDWPAANAPPQAPLRATRPALFSRLVAPTLATMSEAVADAAERLMAEFQGRVSPCVGSAVICEVDRDLSRSLSSEVRAELLERSARQRLATPTT
jgi:hypothetical protein